MKVIALAALFVAVTSASSACAQSKDMKGMDMKGMNMGSKDSMSKGATHSTSGVV